MLRHVAALALASLFAGPASAQQIVGRNDATFSITERVTRGDWVRIASPNGFVKITASPDGGGQVEVRADKEIDRGSIEDVGFVVRRGSDGVTVCAVFAEADECDADGSYRSRSRPRGWWDDHRIRVNLTVRIPAGVRVRAGSGNGDVSVTGAGPEVIAASGNGRVDVSETTGEVQASSGNGRVTVDGAGGPVDASSGNGDIRVTTSLGPVRASSGNGRIEVAMARLEGSPDMSFSTGNGQITVTVPEGFGAELESSTGNGEVTVDFPIQMRSGRIDPSRIRGTIGKGGGRLVMSSGNGDLEIRRRP
jgi:hypothetical protein